MTSCNLVSSYPRKTPTPLPTPALIIEHSLFTPPFFRLPQNLTSPVSVSPPRMNEWPSNAGHSSEENAKALTAARVFSDPSQGLRRVCTGSRHPMKNGLAAQPPARAQISLAADQKPISGAPLLCPALKSARIDRQNLETLRPAGFIAV